MVSVTKCIHKKRRPSNFDALLELHKSMYQTVSVLVSFLCGLTQQNTKFRLARSHSNPAETANTTLTRSHYAIMGGGKTLSNLIIAGIFAIAARDTRFAFLDAVSGTKSSGKTSHSPEKNG